jgi:hypothetical protein
MKLSTRLTLAMVGLVVFTAVAVEMAAVVGVARSGSLLAGLVAILCAGALAVLLARSLSKPLVQMTAAVERFGRDQSVTVPTHAGAKSACSRALLPR